MRRGLERLTDTKKERGKCTYTRSEECHRRKYATGSSYRPGSLIQPCLGNVHRFRSYSYFLFLSWWSFTGNRYLNTNAAESHGAIGQGNRPTNRGRGGEGARWTGSICIDGRRRICLRREGNRQMYSCARWFRKKWGTLPKIYRFSTLSIRFQTIHKLRFNIYIYICI